MPRAWVWVQLAIGWIPLWVLFTVLVMSAHDAPFAAAAVVSLRLIAVAALLGLGVHRLIGRWPWPHPFRLRFLAGHVLAAGLYAISWFVLNCVVQSVMERQLVIVLGPGLAAYLVVGAWLYVMIAAVGYAHREAERSARQAESTARSQLAALRAQVHPHFLFNALHTVVQLIPLDPRAAVRAAELLAGVLRTALEERRDQVPLRDEWAFVQRYLEIEAIRFGDRLLVRSAIEPAALEARLPAFALQTLVENAVRHGATPAIGPTTLRIAAHVDPERRSLTVSVTDDGVGADTAAVEQSSGTGLRRLREQLGWLHGGAASLQWQSGGSGQGFCATLQLRQAKAMEDD